MDRFPASCDGPAYELQAIARALEDLPPDTRRAPRPGGAIRPLLYAALALAVLMAFVGWLLVVAPSAPRAPDHAASVGLVT